MLIKTFTTVKIVKLTTILLLIDYQYLTQKTPYYRAKLKIHQSQYLRVVFCNTKRLRCYFSIQLDGTLCNLLMILKKAIYRHAKTRKTK